MSDAIIRFHILLADNASIRRRTLGDFLPMLDLAHRPLEKSEGFLVEALAAKEYSHAGTIEGLTDLDQVFINTQNDSVYDHVYNGWNPHNPCRSFSVGDIAIREDDYGHVQFYQVNVCVATGYATAEGRVLRQYAWNLINRELEPVRIQQLVA